MDMNELNRTLGDIENALLRRAIDRNESDDVDYEDDNEDEEAEQSVERN
jgi:hypothetical protein